MRVPFEVQSTVVLCMFGTTLRPVVIKTCTKVYLVTSEFSKRYLGS